ncbi:EF-hand domain-containing protein [Moorena sp. SIO3I6]|uniref:EF-hand domain-containing protein n=1 Tax=Moorena sp. SIO3I6 TaxID=2607831 RepID=UPI0013FC05D5|nr:EF-hand domain-containing protein [Moorena sp. SIO3I6]NEP26957.1 EF-hand domain-containing protein [Moorena sp. SIO3I6]
MAGKPQLYLFESASTSTKGNIEYLFNAIDTDFSNTLSVNELAEHLRQVKRGISQQELDYLFRCLDIDGSGEIDLAEFGELLLRQQRLMSNYNDFITYFIPIDAKRISEKFFDTEFCPPSPPSLGGTRVNWLLKVPQNWGTNGGLDVANETSQITSNQDDAISIDEMNLAFVSVGESPLSVKEVNFLYGRINGEAMTWNRFIELLLVT